MDSTRGISLFVQLNMIVPGALAVVAALFLGGMIFSYAVGAQT